MAKKKKEEEEDNKRQWKDYENDWNLEQCIMSAVLKA